MSVDSSSLNGKVDQSNNVADSLKNSIELSMARMTQIESALNKTPVLTLIKKKQATIGHKNVSLYSLPDVFDREVEHKEVLSPLIEEYRPLYSKGWGASTNEGNVIVSIYNHKVLK